MRRLQAAGLIAALAAACATTDPPGPDARAVALPPGEGRMILESQCLNCHELGALELFSGFYTREQWRSLVVTMRANGAVVDDEEVEVLADYLARHYGVGE